MPIAESVCITGIDRDCEIQRFALVEDDPIQP